MTDRSCQLLQKGLLVAATQLSTNHFFNIVLRQEMEIVELKTTTLKLDYCHSMPHESNFPAHFFSMLIMSKKYLMAVKHDTFGERQKNPSFNLFTLK